MLLFGAILTSQPAFAVFTYQGCPDNPSRVDTLKSTQFREVVLVSRGATTPTATVTDPTMLEPVGLYVNTDGRVYWTERTDVANQPTTSTPVGRIREFNPSTSTVKTVSSFAIGSGVATGQVGKRELCLLSLTFDPNYSVNHWVYVYYKPRVTATGIGVDTMLLSRFTMATPDTIDTATQQKLIKMPWTPGVCCHQGGGMDWDAQGNLYLSTGNNVDQTGNNFGVMKDNYPRVGAPKDSATQDNGARTANTMDWRGKVLRIHPDSSSKGYRIPAGNLRQRFYEIGGAWVAGQDTNKILPEVYSFGHRNIYTLSVDKPTGSGRAEQVGRTRPPPRRIPATEIRGAPPEGMNSIFSPNPASRAFPIS